jgi:hypothetical protein
MLLRSSNPISPAVNLVMSEQLSEWWATNRPRLRLPSELVDAMQVWLASGWADENRVSALWTGIQRRQLEAISDFGLDEAAFELARNYFLALKPWTSPYLGKTQSEGFTHLMRRLQTSGRNLTPLLEPLPMSPETNLYHNAILLGLLEILGEDPWLKKAQAIEEEFHKGFEPQIAVDGRTYSQDLLNSAIETAWIIRASASTRLGDSQTNSGIEWGGGC